jgi:hypothetical protein
MTLIFLKIVTTEFSLEKFFKRQVQNGVFQETCINRFRSSFTAQKGMQTGKGREYTTNIRVNTLVKV